MYEAQMSVTSQRILVLVMNMLLTIHMIGKHNHAKLSIMVVVAEIAIALKQELNASPIVLLNNMKVNEIAQTFFHINFILIDEI